MVGKLDASSDRPAHCGSTAIHQDVRFADAAVRQEIESLATFLDLKLQLSRVKRV